MKGFFYSIATLFCCTVFFVQGIEAAERVALVIGNSDYQHATKLRNPGNDADAIAKTLKKMNFTVIKRKNLTRSGFYSALEEFQRKIAAGAKVALFFYSGHGMEVKGKNYLVSINADFTTTLRAKMEDDNIPLSSILETISDGNTTLNIAIIDACRDNPYRRLKGARRRLAKVDPPPRTIIAYGTSPREGAADGRGENGVYTSVLLKYLPQKLRLYDILNNTAREVATITNHQQVPRMDLQGIEPWYPNGYDGGKDDDTLAWATASKANTAAAYRKYLQKFPAGNYRITARNLLQVLARRDGLAGDISAVSLKRDKKDTKKTISLPKLNVLAIGVGKYKNPYFTDLHFPGKDAGDFAKIVQRQKGKVYRDVQVRLLTDDEVTHGSVMDGFDWLEKETTSRDTVMLFLVGKAINDRNGDFYFLPSDADPESLRRTGVSWAAIDDIITNLPGKRLLFIDTCNGYSGSTRRGVNGYSGSARRGVHRSKTLKNKIANDLTPVEKAKVVFASFPSVNGECLEEPVWNNGAFTKALVKGLAGNADLTSDGMITIMELDLYLNEKIKSLSHGRRTVNMMKTEGTPDFTIAVKDSLR